MIADVSILKKDQCCIRSPFLFCLPFCLLVFLFIIMMCWIEASSHRL